LSGNDALGGGTGSPIVERIDNHVLALRAHDGGSGINGDASVTNPDEVMVELYPYQPGLANSITSNPYAIRSNNADHPETRTKSVNASQHKDI
jgi:hypothetical protein